MDTLRIRIKSRERADAEFIHAFKTARAGAKAALERGTYFTSLEAVRSLLTEKRLALLHLIRERRPRSINALAKIAGRDFKNVHADVMLLRRCGLLQLDAASGTARRTMSVPYRAIDIRAIV